MVESSSASESDGEDEPVVAAVTPVCERPCPHPIQRHMAVELADRLWDLCEGQTDVEVMYWVDLVAIKGNSGNVKR